MTTPSTRSAVLETGTESGIVVPRTAVIKVGTDIITTEEGLLDERQVRNVVMQIAAIRSAFQRVILITSGAVACGRAVYGVKKMPGESVGMKRMFAAAGQVVLMNAYIKHFGIERLIANQVLVTRKNFNSSEEQESLNATFDAIFSNKIPGIPVLNENDTVAIEAFTDNDELAALVAKMVRAEVLAILTSVNGVLRDVSDPGSVIPIVTPDGKTPEGEDLSQYIRPMTSAGGRGGMESKWKSALSLAQSGTRVHIANGRIPDVLPRLLLEDEKIGTMFQTERRIRMAA